MIEWLQELAGVGRGEVVALMLIASAFGYAIGFEVTKRIDRKRSQ